MTTNTVALMTALVPTTGHRDLVRWAAHFPSNQVHVLVSSRSFEPIGGGVRVAALSAALSGLPNVTIRLHEDDGAPQNPPDHPAFWDWWSAAINAHFPEAMGEWDYVVASEAYGLQVAENLGASFMPFDIERSLNFSRGSAVREDPFANWSAMLPLLRQEFQMKATLFGQESVGKTTMSKLVAKELPATWLPEWARPYLETVGPALDAQVMGRIHVGQSALQEVTFKAAEKPFAVLDTDLFSTVGYYSIGAYPRPKALEEDALRLASDLYFLLPDDVPFEEDLLRYGGAVRESSYGFWKTILERYGLPFVEVPPGPLEEKLSFMVEECKRAFEVRWSAVRAFQRE